MTEPDLAQALDNLYGAFGEPVHDLIRAKCPRCRRWCLRSPYLLTVPCYLCADLGEAFRLWDLLLMVEFGLSWKAYQAKLEDVGPPWDAPKRWTSSRAKQDEFKRRHGGGRPREDDTGGGGT